MYMTARIDADLATLDRPHPSALLARLCGGESLTADESQLLFQALVAGELGEPEIAALLIALKVKGETGDELIGAARALRTAALPFDRPDYLFADSCGTGGDGSGTINLSTAVAFVAAAAGLPVAKHGNRSVTSRCGSADVLEQLGVKLDVAPDVSRRALDETGICFLFAPQYHPGLRHAGPVRRALKVRTVMNMLGPCVNPAQPQRAAARRRRSGACSSRSRPRSPLSASSALWWCTAPASTKWRSMPRPRRSEIRDGICTELTTHVRRRPASSAAPLRALQGGGPEENAERLKALLMGYGTSAETARGRAQCRRPADDRRASPRPRGGHRPRPPGAGQRRAGSAAQGAGRDHP